jgi:hypothetical protein
MTRLVGNDVSLNQKVLFLFIIIIIVIIIIIIIVLQPFVGPLPLCQFLDPIHSR